MEIFKLNRKRLSSLNKDKKKNTKQKNTKKYSISLDRDASYMTLGRKDKLMDEHLSVENTTTCGFYRGVESSTISSINSRILGSNKRFFDKLYDGSWSESSIYIAKIT